MAIFRFKVIDRDGAIIRGVTHFPFNSQAAAVGYFERKDQVVVSVQRLPLILDGFYKVYFRQLSRRISGEDVSEFLRTLAVMLKSGVPLIDAMADATEYQQNPAMKHVAEDIHMSLESGLSLSNAVERHQGVFPPSVLYLIRMGEDAGLLDRTLLDAATHLQRVSRIGVDVKKALIYPVFALAATLFAVIFWLKYTVPSLQGLYKQMQVQLPDATQLVLNISRSIENYWLIYILAPPLLVTLFRYMLKRHYRLRFRFHQLLLKIPVVKHLVEYSNMAFIFEYFSLLLHAGVDIYRTLGVIAEALNNEVYRDAIQQLQKDVTRGEGVARAILRQKLFPRFVSRMIKTGESSGTMDDQMQYIAGEYRTRLSDVIDRLKTLVEPLSVILVGGLMLVIIGALFFPIYQLIGSLGVNRM